MKPLDLGYGVVLEEQAQKLIIALAILGLVQILFGVASKLENHFSEGLKRLQIFRKLQHTTTCLMVLGVYKTGVFNKHQLELPLLTPLGRGKMFSPLSPNKTFFNLFGFIKTGVFKKDHSGPMENNNISMGGVQYLCYMAVFVRIAHSSRHFSPKINEAFLAVFERVFSQEEVNGEPPVAVFTLWGLAAVIGAFPPGVAHLAILGLSIGTSFAELAGQVAKRQLIFGLEGKSYVACIWNATATATSTMAFLAFQVAVAVLNGVISAIADIVVIGDMNGNLTMPITAAFALGTIAKVLPPCDSSMKETSY
eukprot:jgi/Bigna1/80490/fgenesh1_pg.71_\